MSIGSNLKTHSGLVVGVAIVGTMLVLLEIQRSTPGNAIVGIWGLFVANVCSPIKNTLVSIYPGLDYLAVGLIFVLIVWGVPRLWRKKSAIKQTAQDTTKKAADKVKKTLPSTTPSAEIQKVADTASETVASMKKSSEELLKEAEALKASA